MFNQYYQSITFLCGDHPANASWCESCLFPRTGPAESWSSGGCWARSCSTLCEAKSIWSHRRNEFQPVPLRFSGRVYLPVKGRGLRSLNGVAGSLHRLQLEHELVQCSDGLRTTKVENHSFGLNSSKCIKVKFSPNVTESSHIFDQLCGCHSGDDEEVANDDSEVVGPAGAQGRPQFLHLLRVLIAELKCDHRLSKNTILK